MKISASNFRHKNLLASGFYFGCSLFFFMVSSIFAAFILDYNTFQRLTREHSVASIEFHHLGKHHYQAILTENNSEPIFMDLHGDQWQLDSRIITWDGAAAWSGLKPMYQLERISGRYADIQMEKNAFRSVYSLNQSVNTALWQFLINYQNVLPWLNAYYGSATYLPMSNRAKFNISVTASGLIAKPDNDAAKQSILNWTIQF